MKQTYNPEDISKRIWPKLRYDRRKAMGPHISKLAAWEIMYNNNAAFRAKVEMRITVVVTALLAGILIYSFAMLMYRAGEWLNLHVNHIHTLLLFCGVILVATFATAVVIIFRKQK